MFKTMLNKLYVLVIVNFFTFIFVKFIVRACCRNQIQLLMAFGYRFLNTFLRFFELTVDLFVHSLLVHLQVTNAYASLLLNIFIANSLKFTKTFEHIYKEQDYKSKSKTKTKQNKMMVYI